MRKIVLFSALFIISAFLANAQYPWPRVPEMGKYYSQRTPSPYFMSQPWKMHHIDRVSFNHNSLVGADLNGNGFDDYVVIHEGPDLISIVFHPGCYEKVYDEDAWIKVIISEGVNVEYAAFGDFDGDGNLDIVYANGDGQDVNIIWGPEKDKVMDPSEWVDSGPIPASVGLGHYLSVFVMDIGKNGRTDILAGGRKASESRGGEFTGLIWFECPENPRDRRDVSKWKLHIIDPKLQSAHGPTLVDVDGDGFTDIVVANADWNTTPYESAVIWYRNPGPGKKLYDQWQKIVVARNIELFAKPQVGVGDITRNGKLDMVVQSNNYVFIYEQRENPFENWRTIRINKPEITRWVHRPLELVDLNNNGKLEIVGASIHDYGYTPIGKASVWWMEYLGDKPGLDNWQTHVIKWADGIFTGAQWEGEKWDHLLFVDINGNGHLDILANCEEYYEWVDGERITRLGLVWFENPGIK